MHVQNLHVIWLEDAVRQRAPPGGERPIFAQRAHLCARGHQQLCVSHRQLYRWPERGRAGARFDLDGGRAGGRFDLDGEHASGFFWASVTDAGEAEESDTRLPLSLATDEAATAQERARARAERKHRGKPFAEFIAQWQQVRPSDDKLKYYGDWPEPHAPGYQKPFWGLHD